MLPSTSTAGAASASTSVSTSSNLIDSTDSAASAGSVEAARSDPDNERGFDGYSANNGREEFVTTSRLDSPIAIAAKSGFNRPVTASGIAIAL